MTPGMTNLAYLGAAALLILGLRRLSHPRTAVRGNGMSALGLLLAVVVTLILGGIGSFRLILAGLALGTAAGVALALTIRMTAMPQLVALFNGLGGAASLLVAGVALALSPAPSRQLTVATVVTGLVGSVTLWGSLVAFAKLQGLAFEGPVLLPNRHRWNALLLGATLLAGTGLVLAPHSLWLYVLLAALAAVLGTALVLPIGGADMPVVIALLNAYSGLAAAATGFVLSNNMLIIAGSLVGASGLILTGQMCRAMNRSLAGVLFGGLGAQAVGESESEEIYRGRVKSTSPEEVALLLDGARRVVIVPGYGLAVAQAQHAVRDLAQLLESRGTEVAYAIHPVAGRMPGHMNVLLAEADIPYEQLQELDQINPTFPETDLVLVLGANDVVNPSARTDPGSPIAGMPILEVDQARMVVVVKRSLSPGFAGIPNPLFVDEKTLMLFGDGKKMALELTAALKEA